MWRQFFCLARAQGPAVPHHMITHTHARKELVGPHGLQPMQVLMLVRTSHHT